MLEALTLLLRVCFAFSLLCWAVTGFAQSPAPPAKRALLIGASDYARGGNPNTEWWDLSSAADVDALKAVLAAKYGFLDRNIVALTSAHDTTRANILQQLDLLASRTRRGDVVYVHYSGHGSRVRDRNGDEVDGFDETIVPTDYASRADGSNNISDDEIGAWLSRLAARQPGNVTLSFDSCFSGTQTRAGLQRVRGGYAFGTERPVAAERGVSGLDIPQATARGYVVISAARHDQLAAETLDDQQSPMGLFTYALVKQLWAANPSTTYRDLYDAVAVEMGWRNPDQTPQLEGELDQLLMNGSAAAPPPYTSTRFEAGRLTLEAGSLHGVTSGSVFALYPAGARAFTPATSLTTARVTVVRATSAELAPATALPYDALMRARAVETFHALPADPVRIDVSALDKESRGTDVERRLRALPGYDRLFLLTRRGNWDLKLCVATCPEQLRSEASAADMGLILIRESGFVAATLAENRLDTELRDALDRELRRRTFAELVHRDPRVDVQVRLVPAAVRRNAGGEIVGAMRAAAEPRTRGSQPVLSIGDYFMIELRHTGSVDAYVTVLDLAPDGKLAPIWPHPSLGSRVQENKLTAPLDSRRAQWTLLPYPYVFQVGPPAGREIIKAIATDTPTSFSALVTGDAANVRAIESARNTVPGRALARAVDGVRGEARDPSRQVDPTVWSAHAFSVLIEARRAGAVIQ